MTPMAKTIWSPRYTAKYLRNMPCCVRRELPLRTPRPCASKWRRAPKARPCLDIRLLRTDRFSQFSVLSSQFSVLSSQFSVLSSQFSVLSSQFSVISSQFSVLSSQFSVLSSQFSVLSSQFSVLSSQFSVLSSQSGMQGPWGEMLAAQLFRGEFPIHWFSSAFPVHNLSKRKGFN